MADYASKIIKVALAEVGYLEKKTNSNLYARTGNAGSGNFTKYAFELDQKDGYYNGDKNGYSWCAVFVDWCGIQAFGINEQKKITFHTNSGASCTASASAYQKVKRWYDKPQIGDEIFFGKPDDCCHTGIVYAVDSENVYTVEGNTSGASGVVPNGGGVARKCYSLGYSQIAGFGRPNYDKEPEKVAVKSASSSSIVRIWQQAAIQDGFKFPRFGADGDFGSECESVAAYAIVKSGCKLSHLTRFVQQIVGVPDDGIFGPKTLEAVKTYQRRHGLVADGIIGPKTWKKLLKI